MKPILNHEEILQTAGNLLNQKFTRQELATEGQCSVVFKMWTESGNIFIVKTGANTSTDAYILDLLKNTDIKVPLPKI